jgi:photosystem II stability/assembly factor-like uncharacterized protein
MMGSQTSRTILDRLKRDPARPRSGQLPSPRTFVTGEERRPAGTKTPDRGVPAPPKRAGHLTFLLVAFVGVLATGVVLWWVLQPLMRLWRPSTDGAAFTWTQVQGPTGGKINALLVNTQNPSTIYAGTDGGVYTSRDGAVTWQCTSDGLPAGQEIRTLAMANAAPDPTAGQRLYAGTDAGVYRSTDSGQTWLPAKTGLTGRLILSLAVDPANIAVVYAGTDGQIFKSVDGGEQWEESSTGMPAETVWSLAVDSSSTSTLYAGTDSGIFTSSDGGLRWQRVGGDLPDRLRVQALVMDPHRFSVLYAATEAGVYRSTDAGTTWQAARGGLGQNIVHAVVIDPNNTDILYAAVGAQGVWQSSDAGRSWEPIAGNINELVLALAVHPVHSQVIYAGTGRGVYYSSTAGQRWVPRNEGLLNTNVLSLVGVPDPPGALLATTGLDVYRTLDDGRTWSSVNDGFAHPNVLALAVNPVYPDTLYAGTWYSEIYRSVDGGRTWRLLNGCLARDAPVTALVAQCAGQAAAPRGGTDYAGQACGVLYAATNGAGVFFSVDDGIHWTAIDNGLGDMRVQALALTPLGQDAESSHPLGEGVPGSAAGGSLYAGTSEGVYRLRFSGPLATEPTASYDVAAWVWEPVRQGLPSDEVHSLVVDGRSPNVIYAATATSLGQIYRSVDAGDNWAAVGRGSLPTNITIQALALYSLRRTPSILYAGTDGGIFRSEDGGQNWQAINHGLPSGADVLALLVDADRAYLYSSIKNNGIYQTVEQLPGGIPLPLAAGAVLGVIALAAVVSLGARWFLHASRRTQDQVFERNWPAWREEVQRTLQGKNAVTMDALADMPQAFKLRSLQQYVQEHGDDGLVLRLNPPALEPVNASQVGGFLRNWRAAQKRLSSVAAFSPVVSRIAEQLCQLLGFTLLETRSYKQLHGYMIKAPALRLKMPPMFPIVFLQTSEPSEGDFHDLHDLMRILNASSYLAILIIPGAVKGSRHLAGDLRPARMKATLRKLAAGTAHDFVVMDFDDLYRIFVAKDPEKTFVRILLGQVDLTVVSPYVTSGPVPENMFFGRDYELKTISRTVKDISFAIVGGRKIGKTSILSKLHRLFTDSPDYHSLYLDCQAVQNYDDFCSALETMWQVTLADHSPEEIQRLVARMRQQLAASGVPRPIDAPPGEQRDLVILLDEVDALLTYDSENGESLFKIFRALSQEAYCRFVLCGGKVLHVRLHDPDSALFNFCNIIRLSYLSARDTGRIVVEPMQEMGIGFEDASRLVQGVMELSSCHPNVVQYICQELVLRINARDDRVARQADLDAIANSRQLGEYMTEVMWGNTNALERLITLLIILGRPSATLAEIEAALHARGVVVPIVAVEEALDTLVLYSVLNKENGVYSFTAVAFPAVVAATQDVDLLVERAIQYLGRETTGTEDRVEEAAAFVDERPARFQGK